MIGWDSMQETRLGRERKPEGAIGDQWENSGDIHEWRHRERDEFDEEQLFDGSGNIYYLFTDGSLWAELEQKKTVYSDLLYDVDFDLSGNDENDPYHEEKFTKYVRYALFVIRSFDWFNDWEEYLASVGNENDDIICEYFDQRFVQPYKDTNHYFHKYAKLVLEHFSVSCVSYDLWDKVKGNKCERMITNLEALIESYKLHYEGSIRGTNQNHQLYSDILDILHNKEKGILARLPQIKQAFKYNSNQTQATIDKRNTIHQIVSKFDLANKILYSVKIWNFVDMAWEVQTYEKKWPSLDSKNVLIHMVKEFCAKVQPSIEWEDPEYIRQVEKFAHDMDTYEISDTADLEGLDLTQLRDDQPKLWEIAQKCMRQKTGLLVNGVPGAGKSTVLSMLIIDALVKKPTEKVFVICANNVACDVVRSKLREVCIDFFHLKWAGLTTDDTYQKMRKLVETVSFNMFLKTGTLTRWPASRDVMMKYELFEDFWTNFKEHNGTCKGKRSSL
jgi:hypothetical protein